MTLDPRPTAPEATHITTDCGQDGRRVVVATLFLPFTARPFSGPESPPDLAVHLPWPGMGTATLASENASVLTSDTNWGIAYAHPSPFSVSHQPGAGLAARSGATVFTQTDPNQTPTTPVSSQTTTFQSLRLRRSSGGSLASAPASAGHDHTASAVPQTTHAPSFVIEQSALGNIGLQNAVEAVVAGLPPPSAPFRSRIWLGALGRDPTAHWDPSLQVSVEAAMRKRNCIPVFLSEEQLDGHYNQFCKQVLWKPFHYQLPDYPKGHAYEEHAWTQYVQVNRMFAEAIVKNHESKDIIWVNDYHLMLVPGMVRQMIPDATIGFFLHIPFPSSEIFRCLHVRKQILEGILGADLVGFQTYSFLRHFLMTCTRLLSLDSTPRGIQLENNVVKVGMFPIGINMAALNEKRMRVDVHEMEMSLREKYAGKKVLIGRDKNDYVKGVRQKMLAFEAFLTQRKDFQSKVVLIQVALSTTEENENESQVNEIVSRINSKFGTIEYVPVVYLQQDISFSHYLALLSMADACLITSLRDGMNLTSHEYVVCQGVKKSPLIISEFAGTYTSLGAALRVNPWDTQEVADAIYDALTMSDEEKGQRWSEMFQYVSTHTAQHFVGKFLEEVPTEHEELITSMIPILNAEEIAKAYEGAQRRILFLDYDGTLTIAANEDDSLTETGFEVPGSTVGLIRQLAAVPQNLVYIMSGRRRKDLNQFIELPNVGLCAENGCFVSFANQHKWQTMLTDQDMSWRKQVIDIFEYYTDRTPGSFVQQNDISIIWHFGQADASFGAWQALECHNHIQNALGTSYPITILAKKTKIEIFPRNVNKGRLCRRILEFHFQGGKLGKRASFQHQQRERDSITRNMSDAIRQQSIAHGFEVKIPASVLAGVAAIRQSPKFSTSGSFSSTVAAMSPAGGPFGSPSLVFDFVLCIGDDRADEVMFEQLHQLDTPLAGPSSGAASPTSPGAGHGLMSVFETVATTSDAAGTTLTGLGLSPSPLQNAYAHVTGLQVVTATVGSKSSGARYHVPGVQDVLDLLVRLTSVPSI
ncbi:glycosyltransferase family 20-domain-containing protein [Chytriomyces sp. MP71]|nr:glycosyltransferase family 20-domain-containing protein [Chytriomyces sp. MP71]